MHLAHRFLFVHPAAKRYLDPYFSRARVRVQALPRHFLRHSAVDFSALGSMYQLQAPSSSVSVSVSAPASSSPPVATAVFDASLPAPVLRHHSELLQLGAVPLLSEAPRLFPEDAGADSGEDLLLKEVG